ncbi:hypothetical protein acdb102_09790 [Acidothermaceae bacterium B102]|nr:hypothetical protein acdb102_09790 [Acidothermaceae bacterium B102]
MAGIALITGATGLIGRVVLDTWSDPDLQPVTLDHRTDDLLAPGGPAAVIARLRPDVVVHLAWVASGTPGYRSSPDNARWLAATLELAAACRDHDALLLATGTVLDRSTGLSDAYSASKASLWQALSPAVAAGEVGWLRPFYVIDPVRRRPAVVDQAIAARDADDPVVLLTPDSEHDFVHVDDVARAVALAASHRLAGEVEIGAGRLRPVHELVEALGAHWKPATPTGGQAAPHAHEAANVSRLLDLGWSPATTEELFSRD